MRKIGFIIVVVSLLVSMNTIAGPSNEIIRQDTSCLSEDIVWTFNQEVLPLGYVVVGGDIEPNTGIYGNLTVTGPVGGLVDLVIMDEENFDEYEQGHAALLYRVLDGSLDGSDASFTFIYPRTGTWYMVTENYGLDTKYVTLEFAQDETPPEVVTTLSNGTTYSGLTFINVTAEDESFGVERIQLWIDGIEKPRSHSSEMSYPWFTETYDDGMHNVTIVVEDDLGNAERLYYNVGVSQGPPLTLVLAGAGLAVGVIVVVGVVFLKKRSS